MMAATEQEGEGFVVGKHKHGGQQLLSSLRHPHNPPPSHPQPCMNPLTWGQRCDRFRWRRLGMCAALIGKKQACILTEDVASSPVRCGVFFDLHQVQVRKKHSKKDELLTQVIRLLDAVLNIKMIPNTQKNTPRLGFNRLSGGVRGCLGCVF